MIAVASRRIAARPGWAPGMPVSISAGVGTALCLACSAGQAGLDARGRPAGTPFPELMSRSQVLACAVRLLDLGCFRSGSSDYAKRNASYGGTPGWASTSLWTQAWSHSQARVRLRRKPALRGHRLRRRGRASTPPRPRTPAEDGAGAEIRIDEPWPGYRSLRAPELIDRLVVASDSELAVIELYERAHRSRSSVIRAVEQEHARRSHQPARTGNGPGR